MKKETKRKPAASDGSVTIGFRIDADSARYAADVFGSAGRAATLSFDIVRILFGRLTPIVNAVFTAEERAAIVDRAKASDLKRWPASALMNAEGVRSALAIGQSRATDAEVLIVGIWALSKASR